MYDDDDLAMQVRCVNCLREQYGPAVWDISHGEHPCVWCGYVSRKMTDLEWRTIIAAKRGEPILD